MEKWDMPTHKAQQSRPSDAASDRNEATYASTTRPMTAKWKK
jgi:hypothetical protein